MSKKLKRFKRLLRRPFEWLGIGLGWLVFAHVSHRMLFRICDFIAAVGYHLDRAGRELSRENLRLVMGAEHLTPRREELILKRSYRNMMRTLGHVFWTSRKARERVAAVGEFSPRCLEFLAANRSAITVSCHMGCWELLSQLVYLQGRKIVSVAKDIGTPGMTEMLMKSRRSLGQTIVRAEGAFHPLLQGLQEGADVGLLVDQGGGGRGPARGPGGEARERRLVGALLRTSRARFGGARVPPGEDARADRDRVVASAPRRTLPLRVRGRVFLDEGRGHLGPHAGLHFRDRAHDPPPSVLLGDELPLLPQETH